MDANSLQCGQVVYECGLQATGGHVIVNSMKYEGKKREKFTVSHCDVPFEFYEFSEYGPSATSGDTPSNPPRRVLIPSAQDIEKRMLTLQELVDELEFWRDHIGTE